MTALTQSHSELIRRHGEERRTAENSGKSGNLFRASQLWEMAEEREKRGEQRETEREEESQDSLPSCLSACIAMHCIVSRPQKAIQQHATATIPVQRCMKIPLSFMHDSRPTDLSTDRQSISSDPLA